MKRTRYSPSNIALLASGVLMSVFNVFIIVMTAGFGADTIHDFKSFAVTAILCISLLLAPISLVMFRWCGLGAISMWCLLGGCCLITLIAGLLNHLLGFLILLLAQALIFELINSKSNVENTSSSGLASK